MLANLKEFVLPGNCDIVFFYGGVRPDLNLRVNFEVIQSGIVSDDSIGYSFDQQSLNESRLEVEDELEMPFKGPRKKHSNFCFVIFIFFLEINPLVGISRILDRVLNQPIEPLTRIDEDFYYILSNPDLMHQIPQACPFLKGVKFKLFLEFSQDGRSIESFTYPYFFKEYPGPRIKISKDDIFPDLLKDFTGQTLRLTSPIRVHMFIEIAQLNQKWILARGHHKSVFEEMQRIFNFSYELAPSPGGGTGGILKNGTWMGTTADLYYGRADIAVSTGQVFDRHKVIGFLRPFSYVDFIFIIGKPSSSVSWQAIFWSLGPDTWACLAGIILLGVLLLPFFFREFLPIKTNQFGEELITRKEHEMSRIYSGENVWMSIIIIFGSILEQDMSLKESKQKRQSIRVFIAFWLAFALVISIAYRSKLLAFLAFPSKEPVPETFIELTFSDYKWGLENSGIGGAIQQGLVSSDNPTYKRIVKSMSLERDSVKCFLKGLKEKFACLSYDDQFDLIFMKNFSTKSRRNPFIMSKEKTFTPHCSGFAVKKRVVFSGTWNKILGSLFDTGLVNKWIRIGLEELRSNRIIWEMETGKTPNFIDEEGGPKKITVANFKGNFYLLFILSGIALIVFICEILNVKYSNLQLFGRFVIQVHPHL